MGFTARRLAAILVIATLTGTACSSGDNLSFTAERIVIPKGDFGAFKAGETVLGERVTYVLGGDEGQSLILAITSLDDNAAYDVFSPSGVQLASEQAESAIAMRERGDYQIVVGGTGGDATYDLDTYVYPAEWVQFAHHAALGTTVSGVVRPGEAAVYVLPAVAGLTMSVTISSDDDGAVFDAYPPNGPRLVAEATAADLTTADNGRFHIVVGGTSGIATYDLKITIKLDPEFTITY